MYNEFMSKIDLKIFDKLINNKNLSSFQNNIKKQIESGFVFCNDFIDDWHSICSELLKTKFFKEMLECISNKEKQIISNSMIINYCINCNKSIKHKVKSIEINFNTTITKKLFCDCIEPKWEFNKTLFDKSWDFFIFNWILTINTWSYKIKEMILLWNNAKGNLSDLSLRSLLNLEVRSMLEDIYMNFDSIKFNLFIFNENFSLDERIISNDFINKNRKKIKNNQNNKSELIRTIKELLEKREIKNELENDIKFLNMISIHNDHKEIEWIIDERNNLMHNYFNIYGNAVFIGFPIEEKILHIIFLLIFDNILFFYILIKNFNY